MGSTVILAFITAIVVSAVGCSLHIQYFKRKKIGQLIREDGPREHYKKTGTPTMGGIVLILTAVLTSLVFYGPDKHMAVVLVVMLACCLIGFVDDYIKLFKKRSLGLKARSKIAGKVLITSVVILLLNHFEIYSTSLVIPVINSVVDIGYFYPVLIFLLVTGFSNSVNLTDGLDGLAAGAAVISILAYASIAHLAGLDSVLIISISLVGACIGFLIFNRHPARLFMGDVGSLALGGALAALAIVTKTELLLLLIGGIFVIEALSVTAQVISFRTTGKRIFLMSPLHHHFEEKGWNERMIVVLFWLVTLILAIVGLFEYNRIYS